MKRHNIDHLQPQQERKEGKEKILLIARIDYVLVAI